MKIINLTFFLLLATFSNINSQNFWERTSGLDSVRIFSIATNSSGDIFAGADTSYGIFRSTDKGNSWTNLGLDNLQNNGIVIKPSGEILVSTLDYLLGGGVFHSTDNGNSWTNMGYTGATTSIAMNSIGDIFVGTFNIGVFRSTNNGGSWVQINQGLSDYYITAIIINSGDDIFAGTYSGAIFRSTDNGENWAQINVGMTNNTITSLVINSSGDIFAGTEGDGVFRSTDNGVSWVQINQGLTSEGNYVLSFRINSNGVIFTGTYEGVFRSTDNGQNWVKINQGLYNYAKVYSLAINSNGVIYAGTLDGVFQSVTSANLKVYLQGPYSGSGLMTTTLNSPNNLIPLNSNDAYSTSTYGYTESTVTSIPNSDIVDWVLVELRTGTASGTKVVTRAAFLKNDGTIVNTDGSSPVAFTAVSAGNYYVVIRHRNHLAIMSLNPITLNGSSGLYNFTTSQLQAYGTNPMLDMGGGTWAMISGDVNASGDFSAVDLAQVRFGIRDGETGYINKDINLSGDISSTDLLRVRQGIINGYTTQVP